MKVALVHDFLDSYGGAERVVYSMHQVFPEAPIYTTRYDPAKLPDYFPHENVRQVMWLQNSFVRLFSKQLTFLYLLAFESMDLSEYDVIISSSANFAKGVLTRADQLHINYCHTPPRFLYKYEGESEKRMRWYYAPIVSALDSYLRVWDYQAGQRPDYFLTNSQNTAERIRKFYHRDANVIYPPVNISSKLQAVGSKRQAVSGEQNSKFKIQNSNFFLVVSRLAAYKHVELAIKACNDLNLNLRIVGTGPEERKLKQLAGETISFEGFVSDERLAELYQSATATIYTTRDEDFGITPIEAMSYGCPVIAHRSGGMLETVIEGKTGGFFDDYSANSLASVLKEFNPDAYDKQCLYDRAGEFSNEKFQKQLHAFVETKWNEFTK